MTSRLSFLLVPGVVLALPAATRPVTASDRRPPRVHVVDDDVASGADFADIQQAIDASEEGAILLVREGVYSGFSIVGKGLSIFAERGERAHVLGSVAVIGVGEGRRVRLRGLDVVAEATGSYLCAGRFESNQGLVFVEDCTLKGVDGDGASPLLVVSGHPGAEVVDCAGTTFLRCSIEGGRGTDMHDPTQEFSVGSGATGLVSEDSSTYVYESELTGGPGGSDLAPVGLSGGDSGHGVFATRGFLLVAKTDLYGSDGGSAGCHASYGCGDGGDGGHGLYAVGAESRVELHGCTYAWGAGGSASGNGQPGAWGQPFRSEEGLIVMYPEVPPTFQVDGPVREGGLVDLEFTGRPGDRILLLASPTTSIFYSTIHHGAIFPSTPHRLIELGAVPPTGDVRVTLPVGELPRGWDGNVWTLQPGMLTYGGVIHLAGPSQLLILDADL